MKRVQQKFWQDPANYRILKNNHTIADNLTIEEVLEYCIDNGMVNSLSFLVGENSEVKSLYRGLLIKKNII